MATLTIASALCMCAAGGITASADALYAAYPEAADFTKKAVFTALSDFTADGENYAFADGRTINVLSEGNLTVYEADKTVARLEYGGSALYYADETGAVYDLKNTAASFTMPEIKTDFKTGEYSRYDLLGDVIKYTDLQNDTVTALEGNFSALKQYGDTLYAIKGNEVCKISGTDVLPFSAELEYFYDCAAEHGVNIGDTAEKLKDYSLKFVTLQAGAYRTEIDLKALDGEKFVLKGATEKLDKNVSALLLCYTGNAAIVSVGDSAYITLNDPSFLNETEIDCYTEAEFKTATVTGNRIYASPYVIIGTSALFPATGAVVKVLHKLEPKGVLGSVFYEVEYTDGEQTKKGYVSDGFLTEYIFDDKEPTEHPDPMHSDKNDIKTVLLILLIVILVLAAAAYLLFIGVPRRGKRNKDKDKQ